MLLLFKKNRLSHLLRLFLSFFQESPRLLLPRRPSSAWSRPCWAGPRSSRATRSSAPSSGTPWSCPARWSTWASSCSCGSRGRGCWRRTGWWCARTTASGWGRTPHWRSQTSGRRTRFVTHLGFNFANILGQIIICLFVLLFFSSGLLHLRGGRHGEADLHRALGKERRTASS